MKKKLWLLLPWLIYPVVGAQTDNTVYVKAFMHPGYTVGMATTAAQSTCSASLTCIVVFDPSLALYPQGTMPAQCANCVWMDYRNGAPFVTSVGMRNIALGGAVIDPTTVLNSQADATGSTAQSAGHFLTYVDDAGVFGNTGLFSSTVIRQPGGIGYGISSISQDATNGSGYVHNVGSNFQVWNSRAPDSNGSDIFGTAVGLSLGGNYGGTPWPGAGVRVEWGGGPTNTGQIATAYDITAGITPRFAFARPSCTGAAGQMTCNSSDIEFAGYNNGLYSPLAKIYGDFLGNLRFVTNSDVIVDSVNGNNATGSANVVSAQFALNASAWNGSAAYGLTWNLFHNLNSSGVVSVDHLEIQPPTNLPAGVTPWIVVDPYATATSSANYGSALLSLAGSVWNGSASVNDLWQVSNNLGSGANASSILTFLHSGSTGLHGVQFPASTYLQFGPTTFVDGALNVFATSATLTGAPQTAPAGQVSIGATIVAASYCGSQTGSPGCLEINKGGTIDYIAIFGP